MCDTVDTVDIAIVRAFGVIVIMNVVDAVINAIVRAIVDMVVVIVGVVVDGADVVIVGTLWNWLL